VALLFFPRLKADERCAVAALLMTGFARVAIDETITP
jgi:hypothetical protein